MTDVYVSEEIIIKDLAREIASISIGTLMIGINLAWIIILVVSDVHRVYEDFNRFSPFSKAKPIKGFSKAKPNKHHQHKMKMKVLVNLRRGFGQIKRT